MHYETREAKPTSDVHRRVAGAGIRAQLIEAGQYGRATPEQAMAVWGWLTERALASVRPYTELPPLDE